MKYHNLYIYFEENLDTYHAISEVLGIKPTEFPPSKFATSIPGVWTHQVISRDEDFYFDFINVFLDIIESKYDKLAQLGIQKNDILIWLVYEYEQQCSLSFNPQEMKRLGKCKISLNMDCIKAKSKD